MPTIAVAGCVHGCLHKVYEDVERYENQKNCTVNLVLICGDFQTVRNNNDLKCLHVPPKYRQLGDFHEYYSGKRVAPKLTLFVGGNHEASNYLMTLPYGGWVAHNIYYLGYASIVQVDGLRIGGISGIFKQYDAELGHFERLPFDHQTVTSVYHTRRLESFRLLNVNNKTSDQPLDIMLSHDWPRNIHECGNVHRLLQRKKHFRNDVNNGRLGNPLHQPLVNHLKPRFWFSAHLHVRFEALVRHGPNVVTNFLALDKCLPNRPYLEFVNLERQPGTCFSSQFSYDPEWLAILVATNQFMSIERVLTLQIPLAGKPVDEKMIENTKEAMGNDLSISSEFKMAKPVIVDEETNELIDLDPDRVTNYTNEQSVSLCDKLSLLDPMSAIVGRSMPQSNPDQICLDDLEDGSEDEKDDDSQVQGQMTGEVECPLTDVAGVKVKKHKTDPQSDHKPDGEKVTIDSFNASDVEGNEEKVYFMIDTLGSNK